MTTGEEVGAGNSAPARGRVLSALRTSDVELANPDRPGRYLLVSKIDDDSLSDRRATFHPSKLAALGHARETRHPIAVSTEPGGVRRWRYVDEVAI